MTYPYTSGQVVTANDLNQGGLHLITPTSVTGGTLDGATVNIGTAVSSVTVDGVFSSNFDHYRIIAYCNSANSNTGLMKLGSTATGYYWGHVAVTTAGSVAGGGGANDVQMEEVTVSRINGFSMCLDLFAPYLSQQTSWNSAGSDMLTTGSPFRFTGGWLNNTTSYTSFSLYPRGGTMTGGTIRVYGYSNG